MQLYFESIESGEVVHGFTRATIENHIAEVTDEAAIKYWQETLAIASPSADAAPTDTSPQKDHEVTDDSSN